MIGIPSEAHRAWPTTDGATSLGDVTLQAEDAGLNGAIISTAMSGYTGTGYVEYQNPSNDYIHWIVQTKAPGSYELKFRYALASGDRPLRITINDVNVVSSLSFPSTGSWTTWSTVSTTQNLLTGWNYIRATAIGSSGANIDYLQVTHISSPPVDVDSCRDPCTAPFMYQGEEFDAVLIYTGNNFEGFFTIQDPDIQAYTVYPPDGPFENQTYYYLQVLRSVASNQFWVWNYPGYEYPNGYTKNGVTVYDGDQLVGSTFPVPSIPSP